MFEETIKEEYIEYLRRLLARKEQELLEAHADIRVLKTKLREAQENSK